MATIRSYTSLEQSKKLAEILPLESADMYYPWYIEEDGDTIESGHRITTPNVGNFTTHKVNKMILPCWSLAALLGVLPSYEINNFGDGIQLDVKNEAFVTECDETLLDLVVNMIIHLHELKML